FKHPSAVVFVGALPRNAMGKVDRQRLGDMAAV
ncbi:MAG: acyl-CoA synthetase (AMP-forming)/AMP-acid ligase II, partial [Paracoccaceae bacterium]